MKAITTFLLFSIFICSTIHAQFGDDWEVSTSTWYMDDITYGDIDNDGDMDVVSVSSSRKIAIYRNIDGISFERQEIVSWGWTGYYPHIELGDFNGDGYLDLFLSTDELNELRWFPNDGTGHFPASATLVAVNQRVLDIEITDMDNDGDKDIVTAYYNSTTNVRIITWLEGDGTGNILNSHIISGTVRIGSRLRVTDLNGDGFKDLVILDKESSPNRCYSFQNMGNATFGGAVTVGSQTSITDLEVEDVNGDNRPDVLLSSDYSFNPGIFRYLNNGSGGFSAAQTIYSSAVKDIALADFDGDSDNDLVLATNYGSEWRQNDGTGNFTTNTSIELGSFPEDRVVIPADINSDGIVDLLGVDFYSNLYSFFNSGTGAFNALRLSETMPEAFHVIAEDFDGDGLKDILFTGKNIGKVGMHKQLIDGSFDTMNILVNDVPWANYLNLTDISGDGLRDLIVSRNDRIVWFENMGNGTVGPSQTIFTTVSGSTDQFEFKDLDNDGDFDIIFGYSSGGFRWRENVNGSLTGPFHWAAPSGQPDSHIMYDMDNDGDYDILYIHDAPYGIHKATNTGQGVFQNQGFVSGSSNLTGNIQIGDIDNDGDPDIIGHSASSIKWFSNNGNHTYSTGSLIASGLTGLLRYIQVSDVDLDGDIDLVATFFNSGKIFYFENNGNGVFAPPVFISDNSNGTNTITLTDIDNDGDDDLLWPYSGGIYLKKNPGMLSARLSGTIFLDLNQNGVQDPGETGANQVQVLSNPFNGSTFTDSSGNFDTQFNGVMSSYQIFPSLPYGWYITTDSASYTIETGNGSVFSGLNFGIAVDSLVNAVQPSVSGSYPSCGTNATYTIGVYNLGTTNPSGVIHFEMDTACIFIQSTPLPDSIIGSNIYWSFDTLSFFQSEQIVAELTLPGGLQEGIPLEYQVRVKVDSLNWSEAFSETLTQVLDCSSPSISKTASPEGLDLAGYIWPAPDYLDYTVHFQNTGTGPAQNLIITDQLDSNFVFSSFTILSASHPVNATVSGQGLVNFEFTAINLPDSNTNFAQSMGYVSYRVYLKSNRVEGTELRNSAVITFDLWPELTTNTTLHTLFDICSQWMLSSTVENRCLGEEWGADVLSGLTDAAYTWELEGEVLSNSAHVAWQADSAGVYEIHLSRESQFCDLDTTFQIIVSPTYEMVLDTLYTCPGDSMLIFGTYRSIIGEYTNVLTTVNNCDSVQIQTFLNYPGYLSDIGNLEFCAGDSVLCFGLYRHTGGTYYDTLQSIYGCDSILYCTITMHPVEETILPDLEVCQGDSVLIFGSYYSVSGVYSDTLSSVFGCDSILKQSVMVHENYFQNLGIHSVCAGDSLLIFAHYQSIPGMYYDTLQTAYGCDSILGIELLLYPQYEEVLNPISICSGDSIPIFGTYRSTAGSYWHNLQSVSGCDSIQTVELIVLPVYQTTLPEMSVCSGDSILVFDQYVNGTGTYFDTIQTVSGCDSVLIQSIQVNPVHFTDEGEMSICEGESIYLYGEYVSSAGVYFDTLQSVHGCDSILSTTLSIKPLPVVSVNGWTDTMVCLDSGMLTLPEGQPVSGDYSGAGLSNGIQFNTGIDTGTFILYYVYTDPSGCGDSTAVTIDVENCASVQEWQTTDPVTIYPNPGWGAYYVNNIPGDEIITTAVLYDVYGRSILNPELEKFGDLYVFGTGELPPGTYWLELRSAKRLYRKQFVHQ